MVATARHRDQLRKAAAAAVTPGVARDGTIIGPLDRFLSGTYLTNRHRHDQWAPFAVLFLQWERRYPNEWTEANTWTTSRWTMKELLLRRLAEAGVPIGVRTDVELVGAAVAGPYRCKDWWYAQLARLVDGPRLRESIADPLGSVDPLPRLRARFLLHVLDHPGIAIRRHTWHRWLPGNLGDPSDISETAEPLRHGAGYRTASSVHDRICWSISAARSATGRSRYQASASVQIGERS